MGVRWRLFCCLQVGSNNLQQRPLNLPSREHGLTLLDIGRRNGGGWWGCRLLDAIILLKRPKILCNAPPRAVRNQTA